MLAGTTAFGAELKPKRKIMTRLIWDYVFRWLGARQHVTYHLEHSRVIIFFTPHSRLDRQASSESAPRTVWTILDSEDLQAELIVSLEFHLNASQKTRARSSGRIYSQLKTNANTPRRKNNTRIKNVPNEG